MIKVTIYPHGKLHMCDLEKYENGRWIWGRFNLKPNEVYKRRQEALDSHHKEKVQCGGSGSY